MSNAPRKVIQCDLDGKEIRSFSSPLEAGKAFGSSWGTQIYRAIHHGVLAFGYRWKYAGEELKDRRQGTPGKARRVVAIRLSDDTETAYPSISEAARSLNLGLTCVENALMTGGRMKGYRFYYEDIGKDSLKKRPRVRKKIIGLDDEGNVVKEWDSAYNAAKDLGVIHAAIYGCINSKNPNAKCKGYRLSYKEGQ